MPLKINGSSSGYTEIKAADAAANNTLTLPSASGTIVAADSSGAAGVTTLNASGNITSGGTVIMASSFLRNRIINGDMRIDQRNAGASVSVASSLSYTLDRWIAAEITDGAMTIQRVADGPNGFSNSMKLTTTTADGSLAADQRASVQQAIEGFNISDLAFGTSGAQTVTASFWVKSSLTGSFGGSVCNSGGTRAYPFSYTINSADTWEYKTVAISGETTGTWASDNTTGMLLRFGLGVGSTYSGTAGAWSTSNIVAPTGSVSVIGTLNATWQITGVQLEVGSTATPFERRQYGQELALCQRYYETGDGELGCYATNGGGIGARASFKQTKRATPTMTLTNVYMANTTQNGSYDVNVNGFFPIATATATGMAQFWYSFTASAEL